MDNNDLQPSYLLLTFLEQDGEGGKPSIGHAGHLQYESRARATEALRRVAQEAAKGHYWPQGSTSNADAGIHEGYSIINQFFKQNETLNCSREKFSDFLLTKVTVVRASLPPNTDLNRYFEIMNTRGQQLKQVDIVKARLMSKLPNQYERECFAWVWDACAEMDSYVQMSLTRGDTSLRNKVFGDEWSWLEVTSFASLMEVVRNPASILQGNPPKGYRCPWMRRCQNTLKRSSQIPLKTRATSGFVHD